VGPGDDAGVPELRAGTLMLTSDQRLLLSRVWPGRMAGVFLCPDSEIPALRNSRAGGAWPASPGLPGWFRSYDCTSKGTVRVYAHPDAGEECLTCNTGWPCETAKLIYPESELK
jgi:hypothetical protein